jgi:hypothetical protein
MAVLSDVRRCGERREAKADFMWTRRYGEHIASLHDWACRKLRQLLRGLQYLYGRARSSK